MKTATVLKDISPEIKKGDTLVLDSSTGYYVKEGKEMEIVKHTIKYGFLNLRKRTVMSPNHYVKDHVENMTDYFSVNETIESDTRTLICSISTRTVKKGTSYKGKLLKLNPGSGKYELVHSMEEAEMFQVLRADNGNTVRVHIKKFKLPPVYQGKQFNP